MTGIERGERQPPPQADDQHGVFTGAQAMEHGFTARQVRHRLANGHWLLVAGRGLTALRPREQPGPAWPPLVLAWAAHLTWPDAVIGYRVAAALHGFPVQLHGFPVQLHGSPSTPPGTPVASGGGPRAGGDATVEVLLPRHGRPLRGVVPHYVPYRATDVGRLPGGVLITSPTRTAVDCLATLDADEAWGLFAWLTTRRRISRVHLTEHLRRRTGRPGTRQLRSLHAQTAEGAVSPPERRLHQLLRRAGVVR